MNCRRFKLSYGKFVTEHSASVHAVGNRKVTLEEKRADLSAYVRQKCQKKMESVNNLCKRYSNIKAIMALINDAGSKA